jgi:hypothetical protein
VTAGGLTLKAQPRGDDRLPRILDPLGILPTPRQVLRNLDRVARVLPPVVIETRNDPVYDYGCEYPGYPVRGWYGPPPVRYYPEFRPYPIYPFGRGYGHYLRNDRPAPIRSHCPDRPGFGGRR